MPVMGWWRRTRQLAGCLPAVTLCLSLSACSQAKDPEPVGLPALEDVNVLLIVIDTFGAEHAGFHDPSTSRTPHLSALAERSVLFRRAYSPAPWTQPAVSSLLTGLMPSGHGVVNILDRLPADRLTLAELLRERGHRTRGVVSHVLLMRNLGYAQGFQRFDETCVGDHRAITSDLVTDVAIAYLDELAESRFFLFLHYFDPHYNYNHHPRFDRTSDYAGQIQPGMHIQKRSEMREDLDQADIDYLIGLHREEIAFVDEQIGRLLTHLDRLGLRDDTLIIVTADHGEEFMRHGWIGHTRTLYEELLHVPLIVSLPGGLAPRVVDQNVSLLDIMPTLLSLSRQPVTEAAWDGRSLVDHLTGAARAEPTGPLYSEVSFVPQEGPQAEKYREKIAFKTALLDGRLKLIHDLLSDAWELYDLERDPHELNDLAGAGHASLGDLQRLLAAWEEDRRAVWDEVRQKLPSIDPQLDQKLRSLGYVD